MVREKRARPEGVCNGFPHCSKITNGHHKQCDHCRERKSRNAKTRYLNNPKSENLCGANNCSTQIFGEFSLCEPCRNKTNNWVKSRNKKLKTEILLAYGNKCSCCGEADSNFLSVDHINGYDGTGPRKSIPLYRWIKKNNFPNNLRILCMNCNVSEHRYRYCPHYDNTIYSFNMTGPGKNLPRFDERMEAFIEYGGAICRCCGEDFIEFLCLDHIDNNGAEHRKEAGENMYWWVAKNDFPSGFQVLCTNCNFSKGFLNECSHAVDRIVI